MRKRGKGARQVRFYLVLGCLLSAALILMISMAGRKEFTTLHKFGLEVIGPVQAVISKTFGYVGTFKEKYIDLLHVREENEKLKQELLQNRIENIKYREALATNVRLQKLLELKESLPPPTVTAEIIGKDPSLWFRTLTINRGSSDGVQKGMPVVTVEGVVGQILTSSPNYSKVLLATDPNSAVDVITQKTRVQGIVKGMGSSAFSLNYVLQSAEVEKDDFVLTSGLGGVFPKGLLVGTVSGVTKSRRGMFQKIAITPAVDFSQLEHLIIIMKKNSLTED
jgi:rod shape-determining protein MreC